MLMVRLEQQEDIMGLFTNKEAELARQELAEYKKEEAKEKRLANNKLKIQLQEAEDKLEKEKRVNKDLVDDKKVLEAQVKKATNLKVKELDLDERETLIKAKEEGLNSYKVEIKKLQTEVTEAEDRGYKKGYADGVSDGVRKGLDSTKDDRKMMAQIAAIAAASHTPEATSMIAREVANGIAKDIAGELPATTRNKNK